MKTVNITTVKFVFIMTLNVLADFFSEIIDCLTSKAQSTACEVEHVVDSDFCDRLAGFADFFSRQRRKRNRVNQRI
jgi:Mn-dependent DtxR family transcriptional regulator